jgi:choline dehydrogenase-like flavoprotein
MTDERRVVVIGSGPAGAMAARELVLDGIPVTMLESGTGFQQGALVRLGSKNLFRVKPNLQEEKEYEVSGDPDTRYFAQYALGGMSNCWTSAVPRFAPEDFTEGERLHERYRWPISYADLAPYYEKAERLLDITAQSQDVPQLPAGYAAYRKDIPSDWKPVQQSAKRHGQGFTTMPLADGPPAMAVLRGTAFNSYSAIVRPLLRSERFRLQTGFHALQLIWSPQKRKVEGVVCHNRRSGETEYLAADAVVVACGPLGSVKLLHNSVCSDFPQGLGNSQGLLGHFLHDHPREWWPVHLNRPLTILAPPAYMTRLPHERSTPLMATSWTLGAVGMKDTIRSRFRAKSTLVGVQLFGTMVPSETCLARPSATKKDEFGLPALDINIQYRAEEIDNVVQARRHLIKVLNEAGCEAKIGEVVDALHPGMAVHYGGAARMHAKPGYGVLDAWNRVYGAPNVLVCDAACFTTGAEKNPTLTVMAIAARAATRLARDLRQQ